MAVTTTHMNGTRTRSGSVPVQSAQLPPRSCDTMTRHDEQDGLVAIGADDPLSKKIGEPALQFTRVEVPNNAIESSEERSAVESKSEFLVLPGTNVTLDSSNSTRPKAGGIAFPFKLNRNLTTGTDDASMVTLRSEAMSLEDERDSIELAKNSANLAPPRH